MAIAYISLGSNLGNRVEFLRQALKELESHKGITVKQTSSIYETEPVGYENQADFLNMVVEVETSLTPLQLLNGLQDIEDRYGRKREIRWGPRTLDLDILLFNQENIKSERLVIPHPRMKERLFVLIPLLELKLQLSKFFDRQALNEINICLQRQKGVKLWKNDLSIFSVRR